MTTSNICTENFMRFISNLRSRGLIISAAEVEDCARVIAVLGMRERSIVQSSLRALLAKSAKESVTFDLEFDSFFVDAVTLEQRVAQSSLEKSSRLEKIRQAREELREYNLPEEVAEAYAAGNSKRQQWLREMLTRVSESRRHLPLAEAYINRIATGWLASQGVLGVEPPSGPEDLMTKSLSLITEEEVPKALRTIEALVRRINGASERRYRRSGRDGMPDLRATIHDSLRTGGIPLRPQYKKRPRKNRHVVVLCDVSESMYRFSGFALRFITALAGTSNRSRAYIFSEGLEEISLRALADFEESVRKSELWRRGTDIAGALIGLMKLRESPLGPDTLLIILSDAKTVRPDLATQALADASRVARSVLWLNPDKKGGGAADAFARQCTMLSCGTLAELASSCERAVLK